MWVSGVPNGGEHGHGPKASPTTAGLLHNSYGGYGGDVSTVAANGSAHFVVGKNEGEWVQLADTDSLTWNCGNWAANNCSVAIEFTGTSDEDLTPWQVQAGAHIIGEVSAHYGIPMTYDDGGNGPVDTAPFSGWYSHRAIRPDSGSQHTDYISLTEWAWLTGGGGDDVTTPEQMDTLGAWMKEQAKLTQDHVLDAVGQWLGEVEGRLSAKIDAIPAGGGGGGLSEAQVRAVVREEINRTKLGT